MKIKIGNKIIGEDKPCFIIAEAGVNHNGKISIAKKMVDAAVNAGADAVKFQTFTADEVTTNNVGIASYALKNIRKDIKQIDMLKQYELQYDQFIELKRYCDEKKIIFLSTPHSFDAIDFLNDLIPAYKIGSGDIANIPALKHAGKKGKTIILGTGMSTIEEIQNAINAIESTGNKKIIALHCTTNYPCPIEEVNLNAMKSMQKKLNCLVGFSDHTLGIIASVMAVTLGAVIIEKHFTIDKKLSGPDHKASLNPMELKKMIQEIKNVERIMGSFNKKPTSSEKETMKIVRKSIVSKNDIEKGSIIKYDMLSIKRPGTGLEPANLDKIVGKKIAVITGTRAEYGYLRPLMKAIDKDNELELIPIITGMHLLPDFGNTYKIVEQDFSNSIKIPMRLDGSELKDMANYLSSGVKNFAEFLIKNKPDIFVIFGDRSESFAASIAAMYLNIPIAHINGGDVTGGTVDESIRHAITKISHIHLAHTEENAKRIEKMGEEKDRIYITGATTLDTILNVELKTKEEIFKKCNLNPNDITFLVIQHPITTLKDNGYSHMKELFLALDKLKKQIVLIYPNCDAGYKKMIELIEKYQYKKYIHVFKNLSHEDYLSLLNSVDLMIGNSSSGIIESASFKLPVINIGDRQKGRQRSENIIDVKPEKNKILNAIDFALNDKEFLKKIKKCENKFGDGDSSQKIINILKNIEINDKLIQKQITY